MKAHSDFNAGLLQLSKICIVSVQLDNCMGIQWMLALVQG